MSRITAPSIIVCSMWGARKPREKPTVTYWPRRIIVHHTAGHAPRVGASGGSNLERAIAYARMLQNDMMDRRGWDDSGQSFTVMRSGIIVQGRWGTVTAIERGHMVESAHCIGQNDQPGIEHEHVTGELLTTAQLHSTVHLMAWICDRTGIRNTELYGHNHFYDTACPSNLADSIKTLRADVGKYLNVPGRNSPVRRLTSTVNRAIARELRG